jgi:hypothetical protein
VASSISEKSLQKSIGTSVFSSSLSDLDSESPDQQQELADMELAIQQLQESVLLEKTFESAAAARVLNIPILLNPTVGMS